MKVLEKSGLADMETDTTRVLLSIERSCDLCQVYAQKPRRFNFALRNDKDFNHTVYADTFHIKDKPFLRVFDESTNFQSAKRLHDMFSETLWRPLRICWIDFYVEPPDFIAHDTGKNFMGVEL